MTKSRTLALTSDMIIELNKNLTDKFKIISLPLKVVFKFIFATISKLEVFYNWIIWIENEAPQMIFKKCQTVYDHPPHHY